MMSNNTPNRPHLADIGAMPVGDIVKLPPEHLALLQEDASNNLDAARRLKDWIDGAITHRYAERAINERRTEHKDTGTIRFLDDSVTVIADLPKKIDWDQALIGEVIERIRAGGDDPAEYVEVSFKVPERNYVAWPEAIRQGFEPARTVRTGTLKVEILPQGGAQ